MALNLTKVRKDVWELMFNETEKRKNFSVEHNDSSPFQPGKANDFYLLERLMYLTNQTEWYNSLQFIAFTFEPKDQNLMRIQAVSDFSP